MQYAVCLVCVPAEKGKFAVAAVHNSGVYA